MKLTVVILYLFAALLNCVAEAHRILAILPSLDKNNHVTFRGLIRELANRDHEVIVVSHFDMQNAPSTYKHIPLSNIPVRKGLSFESVITNELVRVPFELLVSTKAGNEDCKTLMNNHQVVHMINNRPHFDVILVESFNSDCGVALAANLSAPYITLNPQPLQPWQFRRFGIPFNSASSLQAGLSYGREPWFFERLKSFVLYHITSWVYYVGSQVTDHVYLYKYLGDDLPTLESIALNSSLAFVNTHNSVFGGTILPDKVIDIGGIHLRSSQELPSDIEEFMNEAKHGVIYVNLGSTVKDSTMPKEKLEELLKTFSNLPFRILWKYDGTNLGNVPAHIMIRKWFPQYDILKHDKVKAFVSHAGILSTIEAVDAGKPVVAIPLFGDQFGNAANLRDVGVASIVSYEELTQELLINALNEVLDSKCQEKAEHLSELWQDRPSSPLATAIYWIEYVARYKGAPHLTATSTNTPCYLQYQLDVLVTLALVLYILAFVCCKLFSVCCFCCSSEKANYPSERRSSKRVKFE